MDIDVGQPLRSLIAEEVLWSPSSGSRLKSPKGEVFLLSHTSHL